jgi:hypothetical protein
MSLFQNSVLNKYLKAQDEIAIKLAYSKFTKYFHDYEIQKNILVAKEEQFQEGFLRELFVNVLGYILNPSANYNLTSEFKNEKGNKKADGAILSKGSALAVIELKGADTTNLEKINLQAFNYKNNHSHCIYVITSNFKRLRFFINNAVDYVEFDLFTLTEESFKILWLCISAKSLLAGVPLKIKEQSIVEEKNITNKLYKDYSKFKNELWSNMAKNNPQFDKLILYKKTQKLLDRMLFILFSEDKGLLAPNTIISIIEKWEKLRALDEYKPLYVRFQKYFGYLNTGRKDGEEEVFAYNGGLFKPDPVLDKIKIDDNAIVEHIKNLTTYNFVSEIDVNILGHIFEHSLNEIEVITAQLAGNIVNKKKSKRKKDGVFYTPKYITKYIVDATVGELCRNKKIEFNINEEEYAKDRKNRKKETLKSLASRLKSYRNWLLTITICDPACGSGAFLNQALEFLILEHRYVDELQAQLLGESIVFQDVASHILEKNLYGTDINEESVEIAKLSLWLRTAQRGRKLTSLNNNIKCGNSLINDTDVALDSSFCWQDEFPQVFANGGFDVVIGNPPYLRVQGLRDNFEIETVFYEKNYLSATGRFDIYVLFLEKAFSLINDKGCVSFILPHKFMTNEFGSGIRKFLIENKAIKSIVHFGDEMVFDDASVYTCIIGLSKLNELIQFKKVLPAAIESGINFEKISLNKLGSGKWSFHSGDTASIFKKIGKQPKTAKDIFLNISQGVVSVGDKIFIMKGRVVGNKFLGYSEKAGREVEVEAAIMKPILLGDDVKLYSPFSPQYYIIYPHYTNGEKTVPYDEEEMFVKFPLAYNYFLPYKDELIKKKIKYKTNPTCWYSLHRSREISLFEQQKIVTPETSYGCNMSLDFEGYYHNTQVYSLVSNPEYGYDNRVLLAILNSSLFWFFLKNTGNILRGGFFRFKTKAIEQFPLPEGVDKDTQSAIIIRVDSIIDHTTTYERIRIQLIALLVNKFGVKASVKLQNWYNLSFQEFLSELKKVKIKLSLAEESEWLQYFELQMSEILKPISAMKTIRKELDHLVYELYDLDIDDEKVIRGKTAY